MPEGPPPINRTEGQPDFNLETWLENEFSQQYDEQAEMLNQLAIVELLPKLDRMGIVGIDGKEHPLPSKEELMAEIRKDPDKYQTKIEQGFGQLLLVPFALSLKQIIRKVEAELKRYQDPEVRLYKPQIEGDDSRQVIEPDDESVVFGFEFRAEDDVEKNLTMDVDGRIAYYRKKTKEELLADPDFNGWNILLVEDFPNLQQEYYEEVVGGRKQSCAGVSPKNFFEALARLPEHTHEEGLTLEDYLSFFLLRLRKYNEVTDAWWKMRCILLGSHVKDYSRFVMIGWDDHNDNLSISLKTDFFERPENGYRMAVRIGKLNLDN